MTQLRERTAALIAALIDEGDLNTSNLPWYRRKHRTHPNHPPPEKQPGEGYRS